MAKRQVYNLLDKTFQTKADFTNFFKTILNKYELNVAIDNTDLHYISELLKRHPEYDKKIGSGIQEIVIKLDGKWYKTRCFHIIRTDGTQTDFSYLHCINNDTSREPIKMFKASARSAVEEQIRSYFLDYISQNEDSNGNIICQKSQTKIHKKKRRC